MSRRQLSIGSVSSLCDYYGGNWATLGGPGSLNDTRGSSTNPSPSNASFSKLPEVPEAFMFNKAELPPELSPERSASISCNTAGATGSGSDAEAVCHSDNLPISNPEDAPVVEVLTMSDAPAQRPKLCEKLPMKFPLGQLQEFGEAVAAPSVPLSSRSRERSERQRQPAGRRPSRLAEWTVDHVASWVISTPVDPEVASRLRENAINGQVLESLTESDLLSMGITKFGWRRQLLLSRQELMVRLEERLKPPEGVDFIQIHSRIATPEEEVVPGTRPLSKDIAAGVPERSANGAGALPPSVTRARIAFDPTFVPTPLSGAQARCLAASQTLPVATSKQMANIAGVGCRASSPQPQGLARTRSGLRMPPSTAKPMLSSVPGAPPPPTARSSMPHMANRQRLLLHSPGGSPRAPTSRQERPGTSDNGSVIAAALASGVANTLGNARCPSTEQHQPCRRLPPSRGMGGCDRGRQIHTAQLHSSGGRSAATSVETRVSSTGPSGRAYILDGPPRAPPRTRSTAPQAGRVSMPLRSLSPQGKLNKAAPSAPCLSPRSPSRLDGREGVQQHSFGGSHHGVLRMNHCVGSSTMPVTAHGHGSSKGSLSAPVGLPMTGRAPSTDTVEAAARCERQDDGITVAGHGSAFADAVAPRFAEKSQSLAPGEPSRRDG